MIGEKLIVERDKYYEVRFPFRAKMVDIFKANFLAENRWYNPKSKSFNVHKKDALTVHAFARKYRFRMIRGGDVDTIVDYGQIPELPDLDVDETQYVNAKLYPYQRKGVKFILDKKRVLVGDEPGLGKTLQSITATTIADAFPALVICPSSLKYNWQDEWMKWANMKSIVLQDSVKMTWPNYYKIMGIRAFITNYESIAKYFVKSMPRGRFDISKVVFNENVLLFKTIIVDEGHFIKDAQSLRSRLVRGLSKFMEYRIFMSGTFVVSSPKDLLPPLSATGNLSKVFHNHQSFTDRYCPGGKGAENLRELNYKLRTTCFFMRTKKDVLKDLPEKTRQVIHCDLTNRKEYDKAENEFRRYLQENIGASDAEIDTKMRGEVMVKIGILKKLSAIGKIYDSLEYAQSMLDSGQKVVIFCWHKEIVLAVNEHFKAYRPLAITGDVKVEGRQAAVKAFQTDEDRKIITCTIPSGGVGLTLTASNIVLFIEMGWSPKDQDQAEDRCLRIGQKNAVTCPYMIGRDTIDEHIYNIIDAKRKIVNAALGVDTNVKTDIIKDIIQLYTKNQK